MKEMVYMPNNIKEVLHEGTYLDHKFVILNLGMHPTAYVECKIENCRRYMDERLDDVRVHGGFTYFGQPHWTDEDKTVYLGWDYGHAGDFAGYYLKYPEWEILGEKKWTTKEIYHEVKIVIEDLIKVENLQIPKKVIVHGIRPDREVNTVSFTCPNCNSHLSRQSICPECNQVLDWSDLE